MRTTLELPEPLYREAKAAAARRGIPLKKYLAGVLARELQPTVRLKNKRVKLPLIPSNRPGHLKLTNAQIEKILFG